jgi:hypothetical protein
MRFASFYPHCFMIFEKARKTAKKEENPRKSRVFWGASFLTPLLGMKAQKRCSVPLPVGLP